jgi:hypothetical protein
MEKSLRFPSRECGDIRGLFLGFKEAVRSAFVDELSWYSVSCYGRIRLAMMVLHDG